MKKIQSLPRLFGTGILVLATLIQMVPATPASALQITTRSLTLVDGVGGDGGSLPGGLVNHDFKFSLTGGSNVGSVKFQYCTTAAAVPGGIDCNIPAGLSTDGVLLGDQQGAAGFTNIDTTTPGVVIIKRAAAAAIPDPDSDPATPTPVEYRLDGVTNPAGPDDPDTPDNLPTGMTFFVRISTYASLDGTGPALDSGNVAAATNYAVQLQGTMPESLVFCTGKTIDVNAGQVPDCSTASEANIAFDRLFSPTDTATATSQMAASTNAGFGYTIAVHGTTLTSGSNTIAAMSDGSNGSTGSIQGTPQFGMNLVANTTTADVPFGAAVTTTGGALYTGVPTANYGTAEKFKYQDTDPVASSTGGSDAQIYTVAYMANVSGSQPAGTYATTLTYICTPKF